jgi:hypothetical protein
MISTKKFNDCAAKGLICFEEITDYKLINEINEVFLIYKMKNDCCFN